ncbi:hypothetical protein AB9K17_24215, partial [Salmonella enterica subsp. enterica serovar Kentucky]|uniref:hypothetical protein n=1 Tax=Salmonella enterica TaxID=28901 RepID=UPI003F4B50E6
MKQDSIIRELRQEFSSIQKREAKEVRANVLSEIQALSNFSGNNAKDLKNLESAYNISTMQIKEN